MRVFFPLVALSSLAQVTLALFLYIDGTTMKCFYEELPKDTLVVGHYTAEEYDENRHAWWKHDGISILITVTELFNNNHQIVQQKGSSGGRFTFTAHDSGDHKICFRASTNSGNTAWLSVNYPNGGVKLTLDMTIGETSVLERSDKDKLMDIKSRVKDLNSRLQDIRREQVFQREREAEFRDQSETTNSRVVRWMLIQVVVLGGTCAWQLSHLRSFFIKQKLT